MKKKSVDGGTKMDTMEKLAITMSVIIAAWSLIIIIIDHVKESKNMRSIEKIEKLFDCMEKIKEKRMEKKETELMRKKLFALHLRNYN
jgi:hypothetical protein